MNVLVQLIDGGQRLTYHDETLSFLIHFLLIWQLRMLYESIPMAYIVEQAGGLAVTGTQPILDIVPQSIHERCPVFMGSKDDVQEVIDLYKKHGL